MLDIKTRIEAAIAKFVMTHNYEQSIIYLSGRDYALLHSEAESTLLGRNFLVGGYGTDMKFSDLEVKIHPDDRKDICIC